MIKSSKPNLRFMREWMLKKETAPFRKMGRIYARNGYLAAV